MKHHSKKQCSDVHEHIYISEKWKINKYDGH